MNLAKISSNGQITVPVEIRRILGLKSGDKILFYQKQGGEIVVSNASSQAIRKAQNAFSGAAEQMEVNDELDVQFLVDEVRYGKGRQDANTDRYKYFVFCITISKLKAFTCFLYIANHHEIVLCDRNIAELSEILKRKAPELLPDAAVLLAELSYELIPAVEHAEKLIRDAKDQPILNAAIVSDVDIILTGDKDFLCLEIDRPKCMTAAQFMEQEMIQCVKLI